jgi:hypothetical protein
MFMYNIDMSDNEVIFPLGSGEPPAPAPASPESGFAEIAKPPVEPRPAPQAVVSGAIIGDARLEVRALEADLAEEEAKNRRPAKRFHADTSFVLSLLLVLIASMAAASFYISFSGLYAAAAWAVGDNPPLQFAVPIMLDISIIAFTLALFIERERGEKVTGTWFAIGAFTLVSITANVFHTFVVSTADTQYQLIIGAVISGGAPLLLAFGVDKIAVKVFKSAGKVEPVKKK